jgi:serpin B
MGMELAFGDADFTKMGTDNAGRDAQLQISDVIQKTAIELDEKGLKAAAATAVVMRSKTTSIGGSKPVEFRYDRPFALVLRDTKTNTVLFTGIVNDPS